VRAQQVQGHGSRADARDHPAQDRRPGHHVRRRAGHRDQDARLDGSAESQPRQGEAEQEGEGRVEAHGLVKILAGTSGYAFKEWKGNFYPADLKDDGFLGFYASKFPAVEINNTFYRLPKENVLREWAEQVPETFTFAIKASMRITHYARLKADAAGPLDFLLRNTAAM